MGRKKFNKTKTCLQNNKVILRSQQTLETEVHNVFTGKVKRIALILMMVTVCNHLIE